MTNSTLVDPLNLTATFVMIVNGAFGLVCNALIVLMFVKLPNERTSFNLICLFRAVGNGFILLWTFFGTFIPTTFMGSSIFSPEYATVVIGLCNSVYSSLQYTGLLIAVNRCVAMFFPLHYSRVFRFKWTLIATTITFSFEIVRAIYELFAFVIRVKCFLVFSTSQLAWIPQMDEKCKEFADDTINFTSLFLILLVAVNVATFTKVYFFYKSTEINAEDTVKKVKRNKSLFLQTVFQDAIILADMLFTFKLSPLSENRIWTFFCGTFVWESVHSLDGFIMLMFSKRLTNVRRILNAPPVKFLTQSKAISIELVTPKTFPPAPIN